MADSLVNIREFLSSEEGRLALDKAAEEIEAALKELRLKYDLHWEDVVIDRYCEEVK